MSKMCAWCYKPLGHKADDRSSITHGIGEICTGNFLKTRVTLTASLNLIEDPLLAFDQENKTVSANELALLALEKKYSAIEDKPFGEVFGCLYSSYPDGCGNTIHCSECQIRNSINHTRATGESLKGVKVTQLTMTPTGVTLSHFTISTERLGTATVLLRIDGVKSKSLFKPWKTTNISYAGLTRVLTSSTKV
jgi:hypothetical protein